VLGAIPKAAEFFSVLSDNTRLRILISILDGEKSVSEIVEEVGISQSAISHQLRVLRQAGVVKYTKRGKYILYTIDDYHVKNIVGQVFEHVAHKSLKINEDERGERNNG